MTPEEKAQLEKDYPAINWDRLVTALLWCGGIMVFVGMYFA